MLLKWKAPHPTAGRPPHSVEATAIAEAATPAITTPAEVTPTVEGPSAISTTTTVASTATITGRLDGVGRLSDGTDPDLRRR